MIYDTLLADKTSWSHTTKFQVKYTNTSSTTKSTTKSVTKNAQ